MTSRLGWLLEQNSYILFRRMKLYDNWGKRLYLIAAICQSYASQRLSQAAQMA